MAVFSYLTEKSQAIFENHCGNGIGERTFLVASEQNVWIHKELSNNQK